MSDDLTTVLQENTEAWVRAGAQLGIMETRLGTAIAHLDNIARECGKTSAILEQMRADRLRSEDREHEARQDRSALLQRAAAEIWGIFKQPLGLLVAAALAYAAYTYFEVPVTPSPVPVEVVGE